VEPEHGFIEPEVHRESELPSIVVFDPTKYGKGLKGLLVVDTMETRWVFEVIGQTREYEPPVVQADASGCLAIGETNRAKTATVKRRYLIRENIESAKIAKPKATSAQNCRV
jgi:hypothetical protein